MNIDLIKVRGGKGSMIIGGAGCGKTTKLIKKVKKCDNSIVLCFTNNACKVIRDKLPDDKKDCVSTFHKYFNENQISC